MKKWLLVLLVLVFVGCINKNGGDEKKEEGVQGETVRIVFGLKEDGAKRSADSLATVENVLSKYSQGIKRNGVGFEIARVHSTEHVVKKYLDKNPKRSAIAPEELEEEAVNNLENKYEKALYLDYQVELPKNVNLDEVLEALKKDANVDYAQKDMLNELKMTPNDPYFTNDARDDRKLWGLKAIGADKAWDLTQGEEIIVAVVDSGVDSKHPDLVNNLWRNAKGTHGYDFSDKDDYPDDADGHGTHVAGTIGATGNNGIGVIGVAPKVKIMAAKIFPNAYDTVCANALRYVVDNGARVINNSWGPTGRSPSNPAVEKVIDYAHSKGVVVVFAAGNSNDNADYYSGANYSKTISVAAVDKYYRRASFSNYGKTVDIAAPGVSIMSTWPNNKYNSIQGTSMASPHVAGLAALILSKNPKLTNEEVRTILKNTATKVSDTTIGAGVINAYEAVKAAGSNDDGNDDDVVVPPVVIYPEITAITKDVKTKETITIVGTNFGKAVGKVVMYPQNQTAATYTLSLTDWQDTQIKAICADVATGVYTIKVTDANGKSSNAANINVTKEEVIVDDGVRTREEIFAQDAIFKGNWVRTGTNYNDNVVGTDGNDTINAYSGNDIIYAGKGTDTINGGAGNDTYLYIAGEGKKTIVDTSGTDKIIFYNVTKEDIIYTRSGYDLVITSKKGNVDMIVKYHYYGNYKMEYAEFR